MVRVRFAPSPTGFLHIGGARTYIFNWLYARGKSGTVVLRIDDTDLERNTEASRQSIFDGLSWIDLSWDELHHQSERAALHRQAGEALLAKGFAYRDFTPATTGDEDEERHHGGAPWLANPGQREISRQESDRRAAAGEPFVLRFRVPRESVPKICFDDAVYGPQERSTGDIEDFALFRSSGAPTYHMGSCADDADLRITHIIRGQDHLANTFKHVLIFEGLGAPPPRFAHLPLLLAPDGSKLSKRRHGQVVSVTAYRDAGFLPHAFVNFLSLLGWSPKDNREILSRREMIGLFSLDNINRNNAIVSYQENDPENWADPKAVWLNAQHIHAMPVEELAKQLLPFARRAGFQVDECRMLQVTPLIQERIRLLRDVATAADFFFVEELPPYDPAELIPQKGDAALARAVLEEARCVLAETEWTHGALDQALRAAATRMRVKAGQMFQPVRVAVCGRKVAPPLFETLAVLGRETSLVRIGKALAML